MEFFWEKEESWQGKRTSTTMTAWPTDNWPNVPCAGHCHGRNM